MVATGDVDVDASTDDAHDVGTCDVADAEVFQGFACKGGILGNDDLCNVHFEADERVFHFTFQSAFRLGKSFTGIKIFVEESEELVDAGCHGDVQEDQFEDSYGRRCPFVASA